MLQTFELFKISMKVILHVMAIEKRMKASISYMEEYWACQSNIKSN